MKNEKDKIKEPFNPENTPTPPQIIDPNQRNDEPSEKNPRKVDQSPSPKDKSDRENQKPSNPKKEEKLLGETETEITDETTL
jgi:hypothetical protein